MCPAPCGEQEYFHTDRLKADLGRHTARGGATTIVSQALKFALSTGGTVILARLLTPGDYGLIGMVAVVVGFVAMFKDMGLSTATIQRETIDHKQISTLFWINVALSIAVALVVIALAPAVGWFYQKPLLAPLTMVYAVGFLFGGLAVQHEALLRRQMRFGVLAFTEVTSSLFGLATAICMAWRGAHYWALVYGQLGQGLSYAVGVWVTCGWRPGLPARNSGVRPMLTFGRNLTGFSVINYFARNLDNLLIGKFWGPQQLGLYAKAYQLLLLPIDQINAPIAAVAVPALSRLTETPERYRQAYLRILEKVAILTMPGAAFMIVTADWIVRVALGPQWVEAGTIFVLLGASAFVQPIANTTGWLFISQGRTHHMLQWGLIGSTLIGIGIAVGLPWGASGVAASYSITVICLAGPLLFWFVGRRGPVRTVDFYRTTAPAACAALAVAGALMALRRWLVVQPLAGLLISLATTALVTLLLLSTLPKGRSALQDFRNGLISLTRRERTGNEHTTAVM